jgi:hypothetical protein
MGTSAEQKNANHGRCAPITGDADVAGPIDDDFTVDPQKAMRGVGVFYVPFDAFLSGKRWRRRAGPPR